MQKKRIWFFIVIIICIIFLSFFAAKNNNNSAKSASGLDSNTLQDEGGLTGGINPLSIEFLRQGKYPGSKMTVEQTLDPGINYSRYIASYKSEEFKIYGLLTIPDGKKPETGWPVIIFNHGYIPAQEYRTTERYVAYVDGFARQGYVVFKSDYRGHGNSEGRAEGAYGSNAYTIDVINAVSSIKKLDLQSFGQAIGAQNLDNAAGQASMTNPLVDSNRIGMWGHSLGGFITLRSMVVSHDIKAGVIWGGVLASYPDLFTRWRRRNPRPTMPGNRGGWRQSLTERYGSPQENQDFWNSISANSYLQDISGPLQLHHSVSDESVPVEFSEILTDELKKAGKTVELYTYPGDNHNISANFDTAMQKSVEFFDKYVKNIR